MSGKPNRAKEYRPHVLTRVNDPDQDPGVRRKVPPQEHRQRRHLRVRILGLREEARVLAVAQPHRDPQLGRSGTSALLLYIGKRNLGMTSGTLAPFAVVIVAGQVIPSGLQK